jgi:acetolactate synthase-1/2/3 large subunit
MTQMTGGEVVAATLAKMGVRHVFGIVSVHNLPIYDALSLRTDIEIVNVRHEQAAAHAADAYSRASGELCVVLTSTGPGAVNALAGLYEAAFVSSKVLMITGQIESRFRGKGKGFLHEHETQAEMLKTICREVSSIRHSEEISKEIARVADDIRFGRPQPGAVEIPIDLQYKMVDCEIVGSEEVPALVPEESLLKEAARQLSRAERPIIWAGGGVNIAGASKALTALAVALDAPVMTTIEGRGSIPEDHHLSLGFCSDRPMMAEAFEEADLVLAVGTRFQNYATKVWTLPLPNLLIHIDADAGVINRNYPSSLPIVGDARLSLEGILGHVTGSSVDIQFVDRVKKWKDADREELLKEIGTDHAAIVSMIRTILPRDGRIVRDSTVPNYTWGNRLLPILESRTSMRAASSAIGPGLPLGIGAALGSGASTVVIQGDGGLMLSIGELATCAEHQIPVIICVFNDSGYGVLRIIQDSVYGHRHGTDLPKNDFVKIAEGMGVAAEHVRGIDEFEQAFSRAVATPGPTLLDIDMDYLAPITFPLPAHQRKKSNDQL